ncbi:helix-turn-helix transcriptional regulator [Mesorhizobium sp.]|uniref:helix-turn-helix domain-containing protein n=1 Tax=Mesorhizobium sp. TaxID=1871066 RepID=UPI000FE7574D|nr:helix-turn-helix transcriptional regulator [Mesorhizobium sp.]RWF66875.1 MAG: XRE family transcriptional regulator [Mesorhizobium sp.]TIT30909.1 MAG: helix-turn-helix transcriptional regulator [Mesorhizobium sp.]
MTFDDRPPAAIRLQQARENAGFSTAKAAAERHGWSKHSYHQHENGLRGIGRAAANYAKAFKVSEAWLLTGEGAGPGRRPSIDQQLSQLRLERPDIADLVADQVQKLIDTTIDHPAGESPRKKQ